MTQARGSRREKVRGRYVRLPEWLLACPAWRSLDCASRCLYIEMARRYGGPNTNNGKIPFSIREAAAQLYIGKGVTHRSFDALIDRGFIKLARNSGFNLKGRVSREWLLTEFPDDRAGVGNIATKDFMTWKPRSGTGQHRQHRPAQATERVTP
jgi:hypothetical protein